MRIPLYLVQSSEHEYMEPEDRHFDSGLEYTIDDMRMDEKTWNAFKEWVINQSVTMINQKTIDKRQTLQTEYQLDVRGMQTVTVFVEENDRCNSIITKYKWLLIKLVEEFNEYEEKKSAIPTQCRAVWIDKENQLRCLKDIDHEGDHRFAN